MTSSHARLPERFERWLPSFFRRSRRNRAGNRLDLDKLTEIFAKLGCPDPEEWAWSQAEEGINQLGRFLFIRGAWAEAVPFDSTDWIDNLLQNCPADTPVGAAWRRVLSSGADRDDLARIVRDAQRDVIFGLCRLLDSPDDLGPDLPDFRWGLFEVDAAGQCAERINFVHESVLELDPALIHLRTAARTGGRDD